MFCVLAKNPFWAIQIIERIPCSSRLYHEAMIMRKPGEMPDLDESALHKPYACKVEDLLKATDDGTQDHKPSPIMRDRNEHDVRPSDKDGDGQESAERHALHDVVHRQLAGC